MQSIGEKLEEARKRRGISIREASDVIKIRSEYLANFESNSFDINVPEVYIRGFLRSYAEFLKLNGEKIITDYNAWKLGESEFTRPEKSRESLGRMDLGSEPQKTPQPAEVSKSGKSHADASEDADAESRFNYNNFDKATLIKGGGAIAGAALLVLFVVFGVVSLFRSSSEESVATATQPPASSAPAQELTVVANGGDILSVIAKEISTGHEIFRGPITNGTKQRIPFDEQIELRFTDAQFLGLEKDGRTLTTGSARGPGRIIYPPN